MPAYYRLNEPDSSSEIFDEEVLAINLASGHYHSLRGTGVPVWKWLTEGRSDEVIKGALRAIYPAADAEVEADVTTLIAGLLSCGLIVETTAPDREEDPVQISPAPGPYEAPVFESHSDMQDLLLIDPIHDVDVQVGWPLLANGENS